MKDEVFVTIEIHALVRALSALTNELDATREWYMKMFEACEVSGIEIGKGDPTDLNDENRHLNNILSVLDKDEFIGNVRSEKREQILLSIKEYIRYMASI